MTTMAAMDPYKTLGVARHADADTIRKAYKLLALKHHPDKNGDPETFKDISRAYNVLSDADRRAAYDATGRMDDDIGSSAPVPPMADIFSQIFAGIPAAWMDGGGPTAHHRGGVGMDHIEVDIPLHDVRHGACKNVTFEALDVCFKCRGSGAQSDADIIHCAACGGQGQLRHSPMPFIVASTPCGSCGGRGRMVRRPCDGCDGRGTVYATRSFQLRIPPGIVNGHQHTLQGKGGYDIASGRCKDLRLRFNYACDAGVRVDERMNVHVTVPVELEDVMCGFSKRLDVYDDGEGPTVVAHHYFDPSSTTVVPGWGLPDVRRKEGNVDKGVPATGDLHVTWKVVWPSDDRCVKYQAVLCKLMKRTPPRPGGDAARCCDHLLTPAGNDSGA